MIRLYRAMYDPSVPTRGTLDGLVVSQAARLERWWPSLQEAHWACEGLARLIGPRPQPGIQHRLPIRVVVVQFDYHTVVDVARGAYCGHEEVGCIWVAGDGTLSTHEPTESNE